MSSSGSALPSVGEPYVKGEIVTELRSLHERSSAFWERFSDADFFAPLGAAWSPADNLRHLDRSIKPVTRALGLPVPLIRLLFGPAKAPSRRYDEIREAYRARLAEGVTAGRFAPLPVPAPETPALARQEMMARRDLRSRALAAAIERWREADLDRCRLPHPALGKLTVREMLLFTVYHNLHHVLGVARRLESGRAVG